MRRCLITSALLSGAILVIGAAPTHAWRWNVAQAASTQPSSPQGSDAEFSPEEKMRRRFPQPARVRDLIGLPVLDDDDNTLGYVQRVVRTRDSKIQLIVRYGGWFGWIGWWQRAVAVPIEAVALLGPNIAALDMSPDQFRAAPTWQPSPEVRDISPEETIRVALTRR
jgi:PRC-barrel domain